MACFPRNFGPYATSSTDQPEAIRHRGSRVRTRNHPKAGPSTGTCAPTTSQTLAEQPGKKQSRKLTASQGDQVANGQLDGNYVADPSDGLGTNAQVSSTTNILPPNWWLQATRLFNDGRGSGREYDNPAPFVIAEGQESRYPADWLQGSDVIAILNDGRGSGRRKTMNLNTINSL